MHCVLRVGCHRHSGIAAEQTLQDVLEFVRLPKEFKNLAIETEVAEQCLESESAGTISENEVRQVLQVL